MRARAAVCVRLSVGAGDADGTRLVRVSLSPFPTSDAAADAGDAIAPAAAFAEEGVFGETGWEASFASDRAPKALLPMATALPPLTMQLRQPWRPTLASLLT